MIISNRTSGQMRRRGFTLVEMMITVTLMGLVLASMVPTFSFFSKSIASLGNYAAMSRSSRSGLELFSRDLHAVESLIKAEKTEFTFVLPDDVGGETVNYKYDANTLEFTRTATDPGGNVTAEVLFEGTEEFEMVYYNRLNVDVTSSASILLEAKSVQIKAKLVKNVITTKNTDYIISARFLMRNI